VISGAKQFVFFLFSCSDFFIPPFSFLIYLYSLILISLIHLKWIQLGDTNLYLKALQRQRSATELEGTWHASRTHVAVLALRLRNTSNLPRECRQDPAKLWPRHSTGKSPTASTRATAFRANAWPYRHARLHRQSWSSVSVRICLKWGRLAPIISSVRLKVTFPSVARRRFFSTPVERCVVREQWQTSSSFPSLPRQI